MSADRRRAAEHRQSQQWTVHATAAQSSNITFVTRQFNCYGANGCFAYAQLRKTWKHVALAPGQDRFTDPSRDLMIGFNVRVSTATAINQKQPALKGTRCLHVLGTSTVKMRSTSMGTNHGQDNRLHLPHRHLGPDASAIHEITVALTLQDRPTLTTALNRATLSLALPG